MSPAPLFGLCNFAFQLWGKDRRRRFCRFAFLFFVLVMPPVAVGAAVDEARGTMTSGWAISIHQHEPVLYVRWGTRVAGSGPLCVSAPLSRNVPQSSPVSRSWCLYDQTTCACEGLIARIVSGPRIVSLAPPGDLRSPAKIGKLRLRTPLNSDCYLYRNSRESPWAQGTEMNISYGLLSGLETNTGSG